MPLEHVKGQIIMSQKIVLTGAVLQHGELEFNYPARCALPVGYRVIYREGIYLWITDDNRHEGVESVNHWDCWRGAWAHYKNSKAKSA